MSLKTKTRQLIFAFAVAWLFVSCSGGGIASLQQSKSEGSQDKKNRLDKGNQLTAQVKAIFSENCSSCHKPGESNGNLADISDLEALIEQEFVIPGSKKSPLLKLVKAGKMPPKGALAQEKIDIIEKWIVNGALIEVGQESENRAFVREAEVFQLAAEDLLGSVDEDDREYMRYFSAVHLYNAGASRDMLDGAHQGLNKLINSLSQGGELEPAKVVNADKGIARIDLRDYGWSAETWGKLVRIYPYLIVPQDQKGLAILQSDTKTNVPLVRTDWFISNASRAPTYFELLEFPDTLTDFESKFSVKPNDAQTAGEAKRSGFNNSAVSKENRVIERIEGANGAYWRSYEFGTSAGSQNVFEKPLGPVTFSKTHGFQEDGGEFIVSLKNDMIAFFLAGRDKKRLSKVPTDPGEDEIIAGISCMACHAKGYIFRKDMVLDSVKENAALSAILSDVEKLYTPESEFKAQIDADSEKYRSALKTLGIDLTKGDPVNRIAQGYPLAIPFAQVAAEVGVEEDLLKEALESVDQLSDLAAKFDSGALSRTDLNEYFQKLTTVLQKKI